MARVKCLLDHAGEHPATGLRLEPGEVLEVTVDQARALCGAGLAEPVDDEARAAAAPAADGDGPAPPAKGKGKRA